MTVSKYVLAWALAVLTTAGCAAGGVPDDPARGLAAAAGTDLGPRDCAADPLEVSPGTDALARALAHYARGRILMAEREHALATRELEAASRLAPGVARIWRHLGVARFDAGDNEGAAEALDAALELDPEDAAALFFRGRAARTSAGDRDAGTFFARLLASAPEESPYRILAHYYLARTRQEQEDVEGAIENLQALIDQLREPRPVFRRFPEIYMLYRGQGQLREMLARLYLARGDTEEAIGLLEEILGQRPDQTELMDLLLRAHAQRRAFAEARKVARRLIDLDPEAALGYERLVETYRAEDRLADAAPELEDLRRKFPESRVIAFQLAVVYEATGRKDKAEALYAKLSRDRAEGPAPTDIAAALRLAELYGSQGRPVQALEVLGAAMTGRRTESAVLVRAAKLIDSLAEPQKTYEEAQRLVADDVKVHGPFVLVGMLAERLRRSTDAIALYEKALEREPKAAIAYSRKADLLIQAGLLKDALGVYRSALEAGLNIPLFRRKMGMILEHDGHYEEALIHYRQARDGAPDDKPTRYMIVGVLLRLGRAEEAEKELNELLSRFPTEVDAYNQLAGLYLAEDRVEEAEKAVTHAQALEPDSTVSRGLLAEVRYRQQRFEEAETLAREILKARPGRHEVHRLLVHALAARERFEEAIRELRSMLAAEPENIGWRYLLSGLYQQAGDTDSAERELLLILRTRPDHAPSNNDLGYLWAERGVNLQRAERMIRAALETQPDTPAYLDSLGWVQYKRGQFEDAVRTLAKATELAPDLDAVLWDHLGDAYWRLSRTAEAAGAWKRALDLLGEGTSDAMSVDPDRVRDKVRRLEEGKTPRVAPLAPAETLEQDPDVSGPASDQP